MGSFLLGLFVGANVGLLVFALLHANEKKCRRLVKYRSECCGYFVEIGPAFRCLKCGQYCRVKEV